MQRQQAPPNLCFTAPTTSIPAFPSGSQYAFPHSYIGFLPNGTAHPQPILQYPAQSEQPQGISLSEPPSALTSPALPNEVFFSPFAHEYTSYFSLEAAEPPTARRNAPFVHRRSRVVMACTYCRRRKIRCDGGDPCANCAKTCRSCDYTPVPADLNNNRRRRALSDSQDLPPTDNSGRGQLPSVLSKNDVSVAQSAPPPHSIRPSSSQRSPRSVPNANVNIATALDMNKQAGHTGHPLRPTGEPASVPSSLTYVPPSTGSQQLQWALVPVWRSEADAQTQTSQLAAPRPGFAASRMSQRMPSLSFPQLNSSGVYQPVSAYQQENSGNPQSTTGLLRFAPNSSQFQEADVKATSVKNYDPNQMHGMIGTAYPSSAIQQFFRPAEGQNAGQEPSHPDSTLYFPEFNGFSQQSSYPLKASSTGTSFSSQDYTNVAPMQTCGSSVGSPPYTPLPTSTVSSYTSAGEMCRQQQDQIKQVYPPTMFMQTLPETPALASPIQERFRPNIMPVETGMVGLGIMMPGM